MRRMIAALLLASAGPAVGQTVKLPAEVRAQPGRLAAVRIEYDGDALEWIPSPGLDVFREYSPDAKDVRLRMMGDKGTHFLFAFARKGGTPCFPATCAVTFGDGPTPPPPNPVPPAPPGPPAPVPPVPPPDDPAAVRLREAFRKDPEAVAEKMASCRALSDFFVAMASHTARKKLDKDGKETGNFVVKTIADLLDDYRDASPSVLKPTAIPAVRRQIRDEVFAVAGDDPEREISPDLRDKLVKLFELLALILKLLS